MSTSKPTIVFFGNERLATGVTTTAPTLGLLLQAGYRVAAVVSHHDGGKSRSERQLEIAAVAAEHNIPVLLPEKPADIREQLASYGAEIAVLAAYGKIVPQSVIDIFPRGIVNIHPSLLPLHRGPTPIESAILNGEKETGVSIMQLVSAMDAGPVFDVSRLTLHGDETKQQLADTLLEHGGKLLLEVLPGALDGSLPPQPQDDTRAIYDSRITKEDGLLDFSKNAERLEREVRAYAGWPRSRIVLDEKPFLVTKAHVTDVSGDKIGTIWLEDKQFGIYCAQHSLVIDRIIPAGKKEMDASVFISGYRHLLQ